MTLEDVRTFFTQKTKYILSTHETPDGDGLGAEYALCAALQNLGHDALILNADLPAKKFTFYDEKNLFITFDTDADFPSDLEERVLVVLDTEPGNIGSIGETLRNTCQEILVIDHHSPKNNAKYQGWLVPESSSTCEMVFRIIEALNLPVSKDMARALYTGIVYDTGSFVYPKTQARTFRIAEALVASGAVPNEIFSQLFESKSKGALLLQSLVNSTMVLMEEGQVAVQIMPQDTLIASGAAFDESQEIVNFPLQCEQVRVSIFLKEDTKGIRRCSIRSKGEVDCSNVAQKFHGGGHKTAAGFKFTLPFEEMLEKVLEVMRVDLT
ncbi:MAG: bifunctional oligoribonuclease/PAP phosphatase NrnA [Spirochaetales bacterium]|nr:bifunctional oligoribonuclease/PAP phosphatase NrnA [Spirochaetales bacterium]